MKTSVAFITNDKRRSGLTLLEVLITIFVMAIGLLSVLTLFPLAAKKIMRSIDCDRATLMAANGANASWLLNMRTKGQLPNLFNTMIATRTAAGTDSSLPSDVIHYDPVGANGGANSGNRTPGNMHVAGSEIPLFGAGSGQNRNLLISMDEIQFEPDGSVASFFRRGERYSCSYLFRRTKLNDPDSLETLIIVYVGRPLDFGNQVEFALQPAGGALPLGTVGDDKITVLNPSNPNPDRVLRRGSWIMDTGNWKRFYTVQSVETNTDGSLKLTLDRAIEGNINSCVWIDYMMDWFDRGTGR